MNSQMKITRFGHRRHRQGVITLATEVQHNKLFIGVSYCSPTELTYDKKLGRELAVHRLADAKIFNIYADFEEDLTHVNVIEATLKYIIEQTAYPRWAENLLIESYNYPHGLKRYSEKYNFENGNNPIEIKQIVVNSEEAKEQLLLALEYIHYLHEIDTDLLAVNVLVHQYLYPENIIVQPDVMIEVLTDEERKLKEDEANIAAYEAMQIDMIAKYI